MKIRVLLTVLVIAAGGYVLADAWDVAPGVLTTKPLLEEPLPYPSAQVVQPVAPELPAATDAAAPDPAAVQGAIDAFAEDSRLAGRLSVVVLDPQTGDVLGSREPDRPALPASNMKVVTAAAALTELGPDHALSTSALIDGTTLYLVGGGDVLLAQGAGNRHDVVGRAGLGDLAEATAQSLKQAGIETVELRVDSSLFDGPLYHPDVQGSDQQFIMEMRPIAVNLNKDENDRHQPNPDLVAAAVFAEKLADNGISVGNPERAAAPESAELVAEVQSAPLRELVDYMLLVSDNTVADVLGHLLAVSRGQPGTFADGAAAMSQILSAEGYSMAGLVFADASGMSISNRISADLLAHILTDTWECAACPLTPIPSGLPVAGLDGTLWNRFQTTEIEGQVRAKTGTLIAANSLSGYLMTDAGRPLVFVILADDLEPGTSPGLRAAMDDFLSSVATL